MTGELPACQIDQILYAETFGRIGCHVKGKTYIIPMNYVYDGKHIYGHSTDGMKLEMMRTNARVCFQVDQVRDPAHWYHVIVWGVFQELLGEEAACALHMLARRLTTLIASGQSIHEMRNVEASYNHDPYQKITVYRIRLTKKTGQGA
ncbi:MAG TPA: pyridoxamine 5'-phosphate oxidase family protein [Ktedonobacteraceae bacterium]|jgi:nitroimidazol reductase NimA-like FMN-containing flavoprotein (pyridoxamine 5'-phosphate oxidase superfamily)|nr:pyridoxamine 5'-phosphate oxidase family protein [Ktedonobacteraceae bacterium]